MASGNSATAVSSSDTAPTPALLARARRLPLEAVVFVLAAVARLGVILRHGGLHGSFGYDASVYFAASDALVHGRMPYRDFVMLHPPALMLVLTPFAALTHLVSDESAFTAAVLGFSLLGAFNAVLVVRVCHRLGLGRGAALAGGLFYGLWFGAVGAEYLTKLEPLGNTFFLLALLAVLHAQERGGLGASALAGLPLGLVFTVKIWWIVPVVAVLVWHARTMRSPRAGLALLAGACVSAVAVDLPFFLDDPRAMWTSIVTDQLGRQANAVSPLRRLSDLSTLPRLLGSLSAPAELVVSVAFIVIAVVAMVAAWGTPRARPAVVLLVLQALIVMAAPSWFPYYCDYLAVAAAVTVAAATRRPLGSRRLTGSRRMPSGRMGTGRVRSGWVATGVAAGVTLLTLAFGTTAVAPFRGAAVLSRSVAHVSCVMSDSPMGQIELDALSRGLQHGCPNWVDVTGRTYGPDRASTSRRHNVRWQRDLRRYLRSGGAVIIVRQAGTEPDTQTLRAIRRDGVLARVGGHTVYRVRSGG